MKNKMYIEHEDGTKVVYELKKQDLRKEKEAKLNRLFLASSFVFLIILVFVIGYLFGYSLKRDYNSQKSISNTDNTQNQISEIFNRNWLYKNDYPDLKEQLRTKALFGMSQFEDDPYTTYLSPSEQEEFISSVNMNFVGIGVAMREDENKDVYVSRIYENTPAKEAGLQMDDLFYEINGVNVLGKGSEEIRNMVLGDANTSVEIKVKRIDEIKTFKIQRRNVDVSVFGQAYDDYYYLRIYTFGSTTAKTVKNNLEKMKSLGLKKIIIDLRDNTGGFLNTSSELLGLFLKEGSITLKEVRNDNVEHIEYVRGKKFDHVEKVVILQNRQTASASEVFIMSMLEQHQNVQTVGEKTYGKGVIQQEYELEDKGVLKITVAKWLSPKGVWIDKQGIKPTFDVAYPDFVVSKFPQLRADEEVKINDVNDVVITIRQGLKFLGYNTDENYKNYFDESLEKAIKEFEKNNNFPEKGIINDKLQKRVIYKVNDLFNNQADKYDPMFKKAVSLIHE